MGSFNKINSYLKKYWSGGLLAFVTLTIVVAAELMIPRQIQLIIDEGIAVGDMQAVTRYSLIMIGLALFSMVLIFVNTIFSVRVSENVAADLREAAYRQVQNYSFGNLDKLQSGELLVRLTSDLNIIKSALLMAMRMLFRAPLMLIGSLIMLIITSPRLALILLVLFPVMIIMILFFSNRARSLFKILQSKLDRVNTILQENIAGIRVVKAFVRDKYENNRFDEASQSYTTAGTSVYQLMALLMPAMIVLLNLGVTAIVWIGGLMSINGQMTTGEIVSFYNYLITTMIPLAMLGMILPHIYSAGASADRVMEVIDTQPTISKAAQPVHLNGHKNQGKVVFDGVSFYYNEHGDDCDAVLKDISFTAEPGEQVAILGATGSGKTTLINLISRFYDVSDGKVMIDDVDVRQIDLEDLRKRIGVSLQESVLFSGTIRENIAYGRPDASDEEIIQAAKAAQAHEFIMEKPDGYDSKVSQRGANFSGGQKQRLAIARAICSDPSILVFDDSTSAVDVETETEIQNALENLMQDRTTFVVAQRISTVLTADKIIVLNDGQIEAIGSHENLLKSSPIYQDIYHSQLGNGSGNDQENTNKEASHAS